VLTTPSRSGRLAFVPARFGGEVGGGAEIVLAMLATGLARRGWAVEILTTTARDHYTWADAYPAGESQVDGLTVRRFPVDRTGDAERGPLEAAILHGANLPIDAQQRWMNAGLRVPEMYHHLVDHAEDYRAIVLGPYPFWPAYACSQIAPERTLLWTCLHDEPYAYLDLFQPVFTGVAGLFLQTEPEHDLLHRVVARGAAPHAVVGCGVEVPEGYDVDGFRSRHHLERPFVLYAGRREGAKGWEEFLGAFDDLVTSRGLAFDLVTIGVGEIHVPPGLEGRVHDLGFLSTSERDNAFAAAAAFVQTSRYEAFSRTVMEAWLAGTPVIANAGSDVVAWHCERSGAGLTYADAEELGECLAFVAEAPAAAAELGSRGRPYVLANYQWEDVLDRVEARLEEWTVAPESVLSAVAR
jgi:glycosyltransferase involved in cell wall biosynthesis